MRAMPAPPRAEGVRERLDGDVPIGERARSLADVARLNAVFGGRRLTLQALRRLAAAVSRATAPAPSAKIAWATALSSRASS